MMKNKKNRKDNSGDALFGRLGRSSGGRSSEVEKTSGFRSDNNDADEYDSIDINEESDSELDINELLRKYMPEYSEEDEAQSGGVLSRIKKSSKDREADDKLISALDSVFSEDAENAAPDTPPTEALSTEEVELLDETELPEAVEPTEELSAEEELPESFVETEAFAEDDELPEEFAVAEEEEAPVEKTGRRGKPKLPKPPVDEYELTEEMSEGHTADNADTYEDDTLPSPEWMEEVEEKPKKKLFDFGFLKKKKKQTSAETSYSDDEFISDDAPSFEDDSDTDHFDDDAPSEEVESFAPSAPLEPSEGSADETVDTVLAEPTAVEDIVPEVEPTNEPTDEPEADTVGEAIVESELEADAGADGASGEESEDVTELRLDLSSDEIAEGEKADGVEDEVTDDDYDFEEEPIDPTDMNLMIAFGLDGKGDRKADRARAFGDRLEARQHSRGANKVKLDRPEFVDKTQTPRIRKEFRRHGIALHVKLVLCTVFTVLLMIFENMEVLSKLFTGTSKQFGGAFDPAVYPTVYIMVSLQLMLLACLCAHEQIADGFKYLFRGIPKPETLLSVLTVVGILYSVLLVRLNDGEPVMFNFMVAMTALFTLLYAIYNHKREVLNFRIVGNKKPKHIVRRLMDEESEGEARAFEDNDEVCDVMKIEKTDFIDGFFGRLSKPDPTATRFMTALLSAIGAIAVLFGVLTHFRGGSADAVLETLYASLLLVAPLSVYITFSYPFYRANVAAREYDSAIIGDASLEEYSNASIISFDDKNVFPSYSVKVQNIRIYNNARVDRVFYYAASVFAYAGGPLQDVFEVATLEMGHSADVKIYDTEAGFLATQVNGVNIFFGSAEALKERGFEIDAGAEEDDMDLSDELSIMYMFRENKLVAKMYIQYVMDADIDLILKQFSGSGLYICVRTFDPNIDERMIARKLNMKRMPLKIVRYASAEEVTSYEEKVDSGLVTCGSPKSLLQVISYCEKVLRTRKTDLALGVLSVMIGAAILVLLLLSDSMGLLNSLYIAIYQLIWMIPLTISSRMFIR